MAHCRHGVLMRRGLLAQMRISSFTIEERERAERRRLAKGARVQRIGQVSADAVLELGAE